MWHLERKVMSSAIGRVVNPLKLLEDEIAAWSGHEGSVTTQRLDTPVFAHDAGWFGRGWNGNLVLSSVLRELEWDLTLPVSKILDLGARGIKYIWVQPTRSLTRDNGHLRNVAQGCLDIPQWVFLRWYGRIDYPHFHLTLLWSFKRWHC